MDDLSSALNNSMIGCSFNGVLCNHLMYTDGACIIAQSPSALFKLLKICTEFDKENTIIVINSKSKYVYFKPKVCRICSDLYLNGEVLTTVGKTKYLGVCIDCDAHDDDDIMSF